MSDTAVEPKRQKEGRSPAYPGVPLKTALAKVRDQYVAEGKYAVPMPSAFKAWGYSAKSSGGRELRASLRYFGLITMEGGENGKVKLTDDALRVILDEREDETEKKAIIRRLAMNPAAHKKLLAEFPEGIKSDKTAEHFLIFECAFSKGAATSLVAQFKDTASFAGLYEPANMTDNSDAGGETGDDDVSDQPDPPEQAGGGGDQRRKPAGQTGQVKMMDSERIAFTEEAGPGQYLKLIACGDVDSTMLEALEDYVKRQKKRLALLKAG